MRTTLHCTLIMAGLLALGPSLSAQSDGSFVRDGDGWVRIENGVSYRVDSSTVSARFVGPLADLQSYLNTQQGILAGLQVVRVNRLGTADLAVPAGVDSLAVVDALKATGLVDFAEPNYFGHYTATPNDPQYPSLWHLNNTGQTGGTVDADVDAPEAWDLEDGDPSVVVAVLDSGTQWNHPDLAANIWSNSGEVLDGVDNDGNGYVDDIRGWDFDGNDNNPTGSFWHGTAVSGTVAAVGNNGTQIVGLAGGAVDGQGCSIMPCNVGNLGPNPSVLDDAVIYAADNGAKVITMSLGVPNSSALNNALVYAAGLGVFIDCASGNSGGSISYPATHPDVMAVGSSNHNDNKSGFSSFGPQLEVVAPGENIKMTDLGGGLITQSGTSFAAPMVAALAGLMFSANPTLTGADVRALMRSTADDIGAAGFDNQTGDGRINAFAAVTAAIGGSNPGVLQPYGVGLAGLGGLVPAIATVGGAPNLGELGFEVTLADAAPNASVYLVLSLAPSNLPFKGGTLLADVIGPNSIFEMMSKTLGNAALPLPIPVNPSLLGVSFFGQWLVRDTSAVVGWSMTDGLEMGIGN